jgi:hypothetical protein
MLWLAAPVVGWWISRPLVPPAPDLTVEQRAFLRESARRTWRFFADFVGPEDNWLPPDNFQEYPAAAIASRTSPTNIGMSLLADLAAYDFGYICAGEFLRRAEATLATMEKLERYRGHFYNWYDTRTLQPLAEIRLFGDMQPGRQPATCKGLTELRDRRCCTQPGVAGYLAGAVSIYPPLPDLQEINCKPALTPSTNNLRPGSGRPVDEINPAGGGWWHLAADIDIDGEWHWARFDRSPATSFSSWFPSPGHIPTWRNWLERVRAAERLIIIETADRCRELAKMDFEFHDTTRGCDHR